MASEREDMLRDIGPPPRPPDPGPQPRKRSPHELNRVRRLTAVTWPSEAWKEALLEQAKDWRLWPSDVIVVAFAYLQAGILEGYIQEPERKGDRRNCRAGEGLALPWRPEKGLDTSPQ